MFEEDDEIGIDEYREDASYIFNINSVTVKLIRTTTNNTDYQQGDFLGVKTKTFDKQEKFIKININSNSPEIKKMKMTGWVNRGEIVYNCFAKYDVDIQYNDIIEFVDGYGYDIKQGEQFRVESGDFGATSGQYCFKNFTITKI